LVVSSATTYPNGDVNLLLIGDSITASLTSNRYPYHLRSFLNSSLGPDVCMVGSFGDSLIAHEAYGGRSLSWFLTDEASPFVTDGVLSFQHYLDTVCPDRLPDIILIENVNDESGMAYQCSDTQLSLSLRGIITNRLELLISQIRSALPNCRIGVTIPSNRNAEVVSQYVNLSRLLFVHYHRQEMELFYPADAGRSIDCLPIDSAMIPSTDISSDGIHPTISGARKMGQEVYAYLKHVFTEMTPPPQHIVGYQPFNGGEGVEQNAKLQWQAGAGTPPTGYRLYFGTDNPPANLVNGKDIGNVTEFNPTLSFGTTYYWCVVPYCGSVIGIDCPVCSFTTTDSCEITPEPIEVNGEQIQCEVGVSSFSGAETPGIAVSYAADWADLPHAGLCLRLTNGPFGGATLTINSGLGFVPEQIAYRIQPATAWTMIDRAPSWTSECVTFAVLATRTDGDVDIVFPEESGVTLPVTLSSFSATCTGALCVTLVWLTNSECDMQGYRVYRAESNDVAIAQPVSTDMIYATNSMVAHSYTWKDTEVQSGSTYWYWLEQIALSGYSVFSNSISITLASSDSPNNPPEVPTETKITKCYPNPFNPTITISYQVSEPTNIRIEIFDLKGRRIRSYNRFCIAGVYRETWDGNTDAGLSVGSGVYFVWINNQSASAAKLLLLK
jgi:hypothetical protein